MITKRLSQSGVDTERNFGSRHGNIWPSGAFITTAIFSAGQLREEKIRLHATFTVTAKSARAMLHFSRLFIIRTLRLSSGVRKIVIINSGIGSCKSRTTFDPNILGIKALATNMSGILWT
jgi:hypothetical protein